MGRLVVVSGLARSGTSWVAKALAQAPGFTYHREPDNADHVPDLDLDVRWWYAPDGDADASHPAAVHLTKALDGRVVTPSTTREDPGLLGLLPHRMADPIGRRFPGLYPRRANLLVKLTRSNLTLGWLAAIRPDAAQVHVLRHPCAVFTGWAARGWEPRPDRLLDDPRLVVDHLEPHVDTIRAAGTFWERAGAYWAAVVLVVTRQAARHPDWRLVQHEWLCHDPAERFAALAAAIDLPWTDAAAAFVRSADRPGDGDAFSLVRDSRAEIDKWRSVLEPADVKACGAVVERFGLPWYPDFAPVVADPPWAAGAA